MILNYDDALQDGEMIYNRKKELHVAALMREKNLLAYKLTISLLITIKNDSAYNWNCHSNRLYVALWIMVHTKYT